jgi:hypothetical protein
MTRFCGIAVDGLKLRQQANMREESGKKGLLISPTINR